MTPVTSGTLLCLMDSVLDNGQQLVWWQGFDMLQTAQFESSAGDNTGTNNAGCLGIEPWK